MRKAGRRARRAWNAAMRGARGKTAQPEVVSVGWGDARVVAAGGDADAVEKLEWLLAVLSVRRPTVTFIVEVLGTMISFRPLRKRLRKLGFSAVFLPGDSEGRRDGVAAIIDNRKARLH